MRKLAIALIVGAATASPAMAQQYGYANGSVSPFSFYNEMYGHRGHRAANGRCNGMSYGTGSGSCGTATGGPSGGLPGRS